MWQVYSKEARTILTPTSGFIKEAGFTHSLSPARNCTYGCTYCYVPTMGIYGGLERHDWEHWGQFTTIKINSGDLALRELASEQIIYCSPLVDPYQPAEAECSVMRQILQAVAANPPRTFVIQTRGPLILRDLDLLEKVAEKTTLRISFSITTDRDEVRRHYEPHCEPNEQRLAAIYGLRRAGLEVYATLAPLLPCNPEQLAKMAIDATDRDLIGDALHTRATKSRGATSRRSAFQIAIHHGEEVWFDAAFQQSILERIKTTARKAGRHFAWGPEGFSRLAR